MKKIKAEQVDDDINLVTLAQEYSDEDKARGLLESIRWPKGAVCPHCKHGETYKIVAKENSKVKARNGMYCCASCRKQFTVTVGTIMEDSHIPLGKWLMAIFILCSSKKSISANQLHRMLKVTYKTAWFLNHRIRHGVSPDTTPGDMLKGIVEVDETYVGGKPQSLPGQRIKGTGYRKDSNKVPVVALIERDGDVKTRVVSNVTQKNLRSFLQDNIEKGSVVNTDQSMVYHTIVYPIIKPEGGKHEVVNHRKLEYARHNADGTVAHVNTCESFFSLLKRGVYGSWHHVSREHLPKYVNEFSFRWNTRAQTDGKRMETAIAMSVGKRLTYRQAV
jgi:transposase-like protein